MTGQRAESPLLDTGPEEGCGSSRNVRRTVLPTLGSSTPPWLTSKESLRDCMTGMP